MIKDPNKTYTKKNVTIQFKEPEPTSSEEIIDKLKNHSMKSFNISKSQKNSSINVHTKNKDTIKDLITRLSSKTSDLKLKSTFAKKSSLIKEIKQEAEDEKIGIIATKPSSKLTLIKKITLEMEEKYSTFFQKHFIDSIHNLPEYYEEYVIQNLKVIKHMNFFFNQISYEMEFEKILTKLEETDHVFDYNKPYLFLDLDETLIHTEHFLEKNENRYDKTFLMPFINSQGEKEEEKMGVYIRPGVYDFLDWVKNYFKLVIFTAAQKSYAEKVLEVTELSKYFEFVYAREYSISVKGFAVKDLSIFNSKYEKLNSLIVDNNIFSFANSLSQGVLISSFYDDKTDEEFGELRSYIEKNLINNIDDLEKINDEYYMYKELMMNLNTEEDNTEGNNVELNDEEKCL